MRRAFRITVVAMIWVPMMFVVGGLARGGAEDFSSFEIASKATAALFTFDSPSLGVPAEPTGELNFAFSESTLRSGPSGYGLGSILWPGQVAAGLPAFLQGEMERQGGFESPVDFPNYPIRAESFHPQGPATASMDAGTMHMRSSAKESAAEGISYLNKFSFPAVANVGNQSSMSSSGFDPRGAVAMAEASANDISLLGGLVRIDSVVTRAAARSDGEKGTVAGTTTVAGAYIADSAVVIDSSGVHVADQGFETVATQQAVNQALAQAGISIELAEPVDTIQGPMASRALGGVLVRIKSSTLEPLIAALPEDLQNQIRGQLTLDQEVTIQLAPAAVTAGAAKVIEFPADLSDLADTPGGADAATGEAAGTPTDTSAGPSAGTAGAPSAAAGGPVALSPVRTTFQGVPVWLVVLLVIGAFVTSRPLMAVADRLLAAGAGAAGCPDEKD